MKKGLVLFAVGVLSSMLAGNALAAPFGRVQRMGRTHQQRTVPQETTRDNSDDPSDKDRNERERIEKERLEKNGANAQQATVREGEPTRNGEGARNNEGRQGAYPQTPQMPGGRAGARMSLEERQRLRRQINEAGRSIYTPAQSTQTGNK